MARGDFFIPEQVKDDIKTELKLRVDKTIAEFDSAAEDEDTLTGHLGANLTTSQRKVWVESVELGGHWTWSLSYRKFRGRGGGATESRLGADGIIELSVGDDRWPRKKSMLFQSKMDGSGGTRRLVEQCAKLSTWREAVAVFSYGRESFEAMKLDAVLGAKGDLHLVHGAPLAEFLADTFVECKIGDTDLSYYPIERKLVWRDFNNQWVAARFNVKHRFKFKVMPPAPKRASPAWIKEISVEEIIKHRMKVEEMDLLGIPVGASRAEVRTARKELAKIYHPDLWHGFSDDLRTLMELRTKEIHSVELPGKDNDGGPGSDSGPQMRRMRRR